ncbi:MAG TPA: hypothetical protein VLD36_00935 [Burkholderiales bacterium]|nr:hypothetical protein [Burkholderiales bacterium]
MKRRDSGDRHDPGGATSRRRARALAAYDAVKAMRTVPIGKTAIIPIAAAAAVPLIAVLALQVPVKDLALNLLKALI